MLVCETFYLYKWTKIDEWNVDKKDSKAIRYSFDGLTTGTLVLSGLLYLVVMALEMFQKSIKTNIYVLVSVYILFTISILWLLIALIEKLKNLLKKYLNTKNNDSMTGKIRWYPPKNCCHTVITIIIFEFYLNLINSYFIIILNN